MSDTPEALDIDLGGCRGIVWAGKCYDTLAKDEEGANRVRAFVRRFKRKGGDEGKPGDYEELFEKLTKAGGIEEDEDAKEAL